jgi:hypothetical protein
MIGNQQELARHLGVNKSTVCRAVKDGRLRPEADGRFDFDKCAAAWHAGSGGRADVAARHAAKRGATIPKGQGRAENATAGQGAPLPGADIAVPMEDAGRRNAKTVLMHYENSAIKLEMALRRGLRLDMGAVRRESFAVGALLRAGIERVIDHTAPRLAACTDALERRRIVEKEVRRLRWMIKRELPRALRRMKEQGDGGAPA